MPTETWAPPSPEYLTAPGYETYAPTAAYAYTPFAGTYTNTGGGGGGDGLTSGDFDGGTDTSTLGSLMSAASLLGGANNLSSFLTGKSLLDLAGIDSSLAKGLLGAEGTGGGVFGTPNPSTGNLLSNTMELFGSNLSASADLGLPALARALEISNATGGLGTTGELFSGLPNVNSFPGTQAFSGGTAPLQVEIGHLADFSDFAPSLEGMTTAQAPTASVTSAPLNLNVPDVFNNVTGEFASNVNLSPALEAPVTQPNIIASEPATGGFLTSGGQALNQAAMASLFPGAVSTSALAAAPGFSALIPSMGGATAGVLGPAAGAAGATGAGAGLGAAAGLLGPVAMVAIPLIMSKLLAKDLDRTGPTRQMQQLENVMQKGGGGIAELEQLAYDQIGIVDLLDKVTKGTAAPHGTSPTSGGTEFINWSDAASEEVQKNMPSLLAARHAGQMADPANDPHGSLPKRYSEVKSRATFHSGNDPYGHREREAAAGGDYGQFDNYIPSGRDLNALRNSYEDTFTM